MTATTPNEYFLQAKIDRLERELAEYRIRDSEFYHHDPIPIHERTMELYRPNPAPEITIPIRASIIGSDDIMPSALRVEVKLHKTPYAEQIGYAYYAQYRDIRSREDAFHLIAVLHEKLCKDLALFLIEKAQ